MKALLRRSVRLDVVVVLCVVFVVLGFFLRGGDSGSASSGMSADADSVVKYVCPMNISYHPYFSSTDPDEKCGYCGMDLVPDSGDDSSGGARTLTMSEAAMKLAEINVAPVEKRFVDIEIPLAGKIDFDETKVKTISAWVDGRLDRLFVDYTGIPVKQGDHLVEIYSPALYSAQEELLQAIKTVESLSDKADGRVKKTAARTVEASREKLKLLGLSEAQIAALVKDKIATARIEIKSPIGGIVIDKQAKEGMYVKTGTPIYTVADLSQLWVQLDAYESDLPWLKYGQKVDVFTEAFGDRVFKGWISFIDPVLDSMTRTVKVRVLVDNEEGLLRPNMLVRAVAKARAGAKGVMLPDKLADAWMCPMHPEVVNEGEGSCDICGMDLVPAAELGYEKAEDTTAPIVIPASAVLITGKRSIVYVKDEDAERPSFEGVEIELGPRAGDHYIVRSGLKAGQQVVVNGNFKIDSALQLKAKPSMMSPEGGSTMQHHTGHMDGMGESIADEGMAMQAEAKPQTLCPIMGGAINKEVYVDYKGYRVYFCCAGCDKPFLKNADALIAKMQAEGIQLDKIGPAKESEAVKEGPTEDKAQTLCPIMGGAINKEVYVDYKGYRIYFCCAGCDKPFMKDPDGYIAKMKAEGIQLQKVAPAKTTEPIEPEPVNEVEEEKAESGPQALCPVMGGAIQKDAFVDHGGYRVYFCCAGCAKPFMQDADNYIAKMKADGIILEKTPEAAKDSHAGD